MSDDPAITIVPNFTVFFDSNSVVELVGISDEEIAGNLKAKQMFSVDWNNIVRLAHAQWSPIGNLFACDFHGDFYAIGEQVRHEI